MVSAGLTVHLGSAAMVCNWGWLAVSRANSRNQACVSSHPAVSQGLSMVAGVPRSAKEQAPVARWFLVCSSAMFALQIFIGNLGPK